MKADLLGEAVLRSYPETFIKDATPGGSYLQSIYYQGLNAQRVLVAKKSKNQTALEKMKEAQGLMRSVVNTI